MYTERSRLLFVFEINHSHERVSATQSRVTLKVRSAVSCYHFIALGLEIGACVCLNGSVWQAV